MIALSTVIMRSFWNKINSLNETATDFVALSLL